MFQLEISDSRLLPDIADCHQACFPNSFSTKLGKKYVIKSLSWFLDHPKRFLFHIRSQQKVVGYCGGFLPVKVGDGSSSGMIQQGFNEAVLGIVKNPLLLFHSELRPHYPLIWLNIKRKITGKIIPINPKSTSQNNKPFDPAVGLVVIGVHPDARGTEVIKMLMYAFDENVKALQKNEGQLSVRKDNSRAIHAYEKYGWSVKLEKDDALVMHKLL